MHARVSILLLAAFFAAAANGATVTLHLHTFGPATATPNTWVLYAQTSVLDNDGLNGYLVEHANTTRISHNVIGQSFSGSLLRGFTFNSLTGEQIYGAQNPFNVGSLIYGVANRSFVVPDGGAFTNVGMPPVGGPFGPVVLSSGRGPYLAVDISSADAQVFAPGQAAILGTLSIVADVEIIVTRDNAPPADTDGDGVADAADNCLAVANASQTDSNGDDIGNACDPDVAGPGGAGDDDCMVNFLDLGVFRAAFFGSDPHLDLSGPGGEPDGVVNFVDLNVVKSFFLGPPGPSGLPNACSALR